MMSLSGAATACARAAALVPLTGLCFADFLMARGQRSVRHRASWLSRTASRHARWIGLEIHVHGKPPSSGLVVANHVSYLDIVALSAVARCVFVSKKEVERWPLFGAYARLGGTIFVDREKRSVVGSVSDKMGAVLAAGVPVVLFPEGTSSDGSDVLPFRSSLLEPVVVTGCPVASCALRYSIVEGSVAEDVAYWRDMTLAPHLLNLIGKRRVTLDVFFGESAPRSGNRKTLARDLEGEVRAMLAAGLKAWCGQCTRIDGTGL